MTHLFLAVPGWRCSAYHVRSREALLVECMERGVQLSIHPDMTSGLERARNISVATALKTDFTHFLFVDADIIFEPADVFDMIAAGFDVCGVAYPKKGIDWEMAVKAVKAGIEADRLPEHCGTFVLNAGGRAKMFTDRETGKRYVEVAEVGTGFLLLKRVAIEKFITHWRDEIAYLTDYAPKGEVQHNIWDHERDPACELEEAIRALRKSALEFAADVTGAPGRWKDVCVRYSNAVANQPASLGRYLTEDYAFCRRWAMMGGKVMCAVDVPLAHQGTTIFQGFLGHHIPHRSESEAAE